MNNCISRNSLATILILAGGCALNANAGSLTLVTPRDSSIPPIEQGLSDSGLPVISADGRFVLFASSSPNLSPAGNNPSPSLRPLTVKVFLRDRSNATTRLASVSASGNSPDGDSFPSAFSTNGRYVLFESSATDLVTGDSNLSSDIFLRDLDTPTTLLISKGTGGTSGNRGSRNSVMTPNGRFVVFVSDATDLVANDTNGIPDVFLRDVQSGTTVLVSAGAAPVTAIGSDAPDITPDGRYVAYFSTATNLVPGVRTSGEVYVRDLQSGTTIWVSTNARSLYRTITGSTNITSCNHRISADGRFVAFEACTNLVSGTSARGVILRHDLQTGLTDVVHTNANVPMLAFASIRNLAMSSDGRFIAFVANEYGAAGTTTSIYLRDSQSGLNTLVSGDTNNLVATNSICDSPMVSEDGRQIAFVSNASGLTTNDLAPGYHIYVRDMQAGTTRVVDADGASSSLEFNVAPFMSADGQSIAFATANGNQVANDRNRSSDVFVRNLVSGQMETVSVRDSALASSAPATTAGVSSSFSVSSNGRYVTFDSDANDVAPGDANGFRDVFVRDLVSGTNILVSTSTGGGAASGPSFQAAVSGDGRFVAFTSWASNLVDNDGNKYPDVFLHDLTNGTTALISVSTNGSGGNRDSFLPVVSQDGRFVMFRSKASDLAPGPFNTTWGGTFLRDLQAGVTYALATSGNNNLPDAAMTPDGHYVAVRTGTTSVGVWDSLAATFIYTNSPAVQAAISPDGQRLAVLTNATLVVADLGTGTNRIVASGSFGSSSVFRFSGDGRFLVYAMRDDSSVADTNAASDVYLYDSLSDTSDLISQSFDSLGTPNGASDSPDVSTDGRYVAYRTAASDTIPGDLNGSPDIVLYDRLSGSTRVVSRNISGVSTANYRSLAPVFSGDGQTLVFASSASDLVTGDFNFANDLFALSLTSPAITDTDGDSMDDQWELDHFSTMSRDGTGDFDNDGATDLFEFRTGTDASSTGSIFRVEIVQSTTPGESPVLTWPLAPGNSYHTQFKNDLNESSWQELNGRVVLLGDRGYVTDLGSASTQRYYRIVLTN